jgi:hypothetical protein
VRDIRNKSTYIDFESSANLVRFSIGRIDKAFTFYELRSGFLAPRSNWSCKAKISDIC